MTAEAANVAIAASEEAVLQRRPSTTLIDLSDDVLDLIAGPLDRKSFYNFACVHPRLRSICRNSAQLERIETTVVDLFLNCFVRLDPSRVRVLNISNCWSSPMWIDELIKACGNLEELHAVNSSLALYGLLVVLKFLRKLRILSVSIAEISCSWVLHVGFGLHESIRKIYVEFSPGRGVIDSVIRLLIACPGVESLHMDIGPPVTKGYYHCGGGSLSLSEERWNSFKTIILSRIRGGSFSSAVSFLFRENAFLRRYFTERYYEKICWFERDENLLRPDRLQPRFLGPKPGTLSHLYQVLELKDVDLVELPDRFHDGQLALRVLTPDLETIVEMPAMNALSSLVELDLSCCSAKFSAKSWESLANSSAAVEVLSVCAYSLCPSFPGHFRLAESEAVMMALTRLKLKKMVVISNIVNRPKNLDRLSGTFLKYLSEFRCLEELHLSAAVLRDDFFDSLEKPCTVKFAKFYLRKPQHLEGFTRFLKLCKTLRYLRLEGPGMIFCGLVFNSLSEVNLKQLCLRTSCEAIAMPAEEFKKSVRKLYESIEVLHIHLSALKCDLWEHFVRSPPLTDTFLRNSVFQCRSQMLFEVINEAEEIPNRRPKVFHGHCEHWASKGLTFEALCIEGRDLCYLSYEWLVAQGPIISYNSL